MFHQCDAVALPAALERIFVQFDTDAAAAAFSGALASLLRRRRATPPKRLLLGFIYWSSGRELVILLVFCNLISRF